VLAYPSVNETGSQVSKVESGISSICLKISFFLYLLFIHLDKLDTRWERSCEMSVNRVFSLISYIFAHNTFFLPAVKISDKLCIQKKTKPNTRIQ